MELGSLSSCLAIILAGVKIEKLAHKEKQSCEQLGRFINKSP